jgi:hypothetical protein
MKTLADSGMSTKVWISALACITVCSSVPAQCPNDWIKTDGFPGAGVEPEVYAVTSWDPDGAGPEQPRLVAGGLFTYMTDSIADSIAALNPETGQWEDLAGGIDFISMDKDGNTFDEGTVISLAVYQNDLIVGGIITHAGDVPANSIARWNGTSWSPLGTGLGGAVNAMTVYPPGGGELIASGIFSATGSGTVVNRIARWNGTSWLPLGPPGGPAGMNGPVNNITVHNGELIAVGQFTSAGGVAVNNIARWNGMNWQPLGTGLNANGFGLAVLGNDLYVGGNFTLAGGVPNTRGVARWDGVNWHAVDGGPLNAVNTLVTYNGDVVASGLFNTNVDGQQLNGLARLDGSSQTWGPMAPGYDESGGAFRFAVHNDDLYAVGFFRKIGGRSASGIARWSDVTQAWDRLSPGFDWTPSHFTTYRGDLIAAGSFESAGDVQARAVARWDGTDWHALGSGIGLNVPGIVDSLEVYNDQLIVGGNFFHAGGVPVLHIAAWDGDTETWADVGGGISGGCPINRAHALAVYNGDLIAGGCFDSAGGVPAFNIARWDGTQWHAMGAGVGVPRSMAVYNGNLYVSVSTGLDGMQRWDGTQWHAVPGGFNGFSMTVYDGKLISGAQTPHAYDGSTWTPLPGWSWDPNGIGLIISGYAVLNGELIVAGMFEDPAGVTDSDHLVRFNGQTQTWSSMTTPNGTTDSITSGIWVHNGELITGGRINHLDGTMSNWRRWGPACPFADITQDGSVNIDDLLAVINSWGVCQPPPAACAADLDGNGIVNIDDLLAVINNFGTES